MAENVLEDFNKIRANVCNCEGHSDGNFSFMEEAGERCAVTRSKNAGHICPWACPSFVCVLSFHLSPQSHQLIPISLAPGRREKRENGQGGRQGEGNTGAKGNIGIWRK